MNKIKRVISLILTVVMLISTVLSTSILVQASMLPLEEKEVCLLLIDKTKEELTSLPIKDVLNNFLDYSGQYVAVSKNATTVWQYVKSDEDGIEEYKQIDIARNDRIDLSAPEDNISEYTKELIIGSENQLDKENIRYIVRIYLSQTPTEEIEYELYAEKSNGQRDKVTPERVEKGINTQLGSSVAVTQYVVSSPDSESTYYLNVKSEADKHPNITTEIYDFWDYILSSYTGGTPTNRADTTLNQNMKNSGTGREVTSGGTSMFILMYRDKNGDLVGLPSYIGFSFVKDASYVKGSLYKKNGSQFNDVIMQTTDAITFDDIDAVFEGQGVQQICLMLKEGYSVDEDYYCVLDSHGVDEGWENANTHVTKAVEGLYDSLNDASGCTDIKDQLIPSDSTSSSRGYKANYNYRNQGVPFTIFFEDGAIRKIIVLVTEYVSDFDENYVRSFTEKPIIGAADPWLRVTGASSTSGKKYDTYVVENGKNINMDTYYGYGYQTIFINDSNADLSNIKPEFWYANTDRVYAVSKDTGKKIDENHTRDFSNENQQYTGIITENEKENGRNYWITFKKLNNKGPELYVYGPREREVILDEYFEFKHDILIANIGNAPLEDISVELKDAENVKLDPYWTVGDDGNNTLAAFSTTSKTTKYGELPNLAKIRLLPDGDGEVKGTLIIRAKNQEPVMITLNGTAQNPEIVTETLSEAVKYVPYQHIVATNNMHDWVDTEFSIVNGALPAGVTLNSSTGEIYGVPTEPEGDVAETYTFTVEAKYLVEGEEGYFNPSQKEFTLTVKPNTDSNVYLASDSDEGYYIQEHIGTETTQYHYELDEFIDTLFVSNGTYGEFQGLWLNGVLLVEGEDYSSEEGSTRITINSQTFENKAKPNETNTIAMEFRNDSNEVNRTSQNFVPKKDVSVQNVINKIAALPSNITLANKSEVQSARSAYNGLTSSQRSKVTNYSKLTAAESKIAQLEEAAANQAAADKVISAISSLPSTITLNNEAAIKSARNAYNSLTSTQKALVTNYERLTKAEAAIKQLKEQQAQIEADKKEANKVVALIDSIPSPITLDDKSKVNDARNAYNLLTASQKSYVQNYSKLTDAEKKIVELENAEKEQAQINAVIAAINAIPDSPTLSDKGTVTAARQAYNGLTATQKNKVVNYKILTDAENTIAALEAQENANKADKAAAQKVIDAIDAIPEQLSLSDKATVDSARKAYDSLTGNQKNLVSNYGVLTDAEAAIKALEDYENASKKDKEAADEVIKLIDSIPNNIQLSDKDTVEKARDAYNQLTDTQKGIVTNYPELEAAEVKIAELEADNYEEVQSITFVGILVDKNGNSLSDRVVEIHSTVQTGRTDSNGSFQFNDLEFGKHTIYIKNDKGATVAQKVFNVILGSPTALSGNDIITQNGQTVTLTVELDGSNLNFIQLEEGNKAPEVTPSDDKQQGINIGEDDTKISDSSVNKDKDMISPKTGNDSGIVFWITVLIVSTFGFVSLLAYNINLSKKGKRITK